MSKVEFYSILLTQEPSSSWELEGYKSYDLSGRIVVVENVRGDIEN